MKAVWYERKGAARDVLTFGDRPDPSPGPGEVRVKIVVSGLNPSDLKGRSGWRGALEMQYPLIVPHQDGAGIIDQVGPGVAQARIGQRVWLYEAQRGRPFGTAAEYAVVPAEQAVPLPDTVSFDAGAALGVPALTAHRALFIDGSILGQTVLVTGGAGAVGQAAVLLAKWAGARVIATVSRVEQAEVATASGADWVINRKDEDVVARIRAVTGGAGIDRAVDVAFEANLDANLAVLKPNGAISTYAPAAEYPDIKMPFYQLFAKAITVHLIFVYAMSRASHEEAVRDVTASLLAGRYRPHIGPRFPLAQVAAAHEALESGKTVGKILIDVAHA
jgi:NADPH2:quinone reductase